ncbi:MAG TPA: STAS domain-containing protein [Solirubrobacteraceae bacterium]|nr:STAS domain-containing protein [Solirubrobacteraceae bacterium]
MSLADVHISHEPGALVARLVGEVDMSNAEELGATVIGATPNQARGVVLDLTQVDYLDSAGIYVIHGMRASLQARGQLLVLVIPPDSPVYDTLRLSGAERPGEVVEELDAGLAALEASASEDA